MLVGKDQTRITFNKTQIQGVQVYITTTHSSGQGPSCIALGIQSDCRLTTILENSNGNIKYEKLICSVPV